MSWVAALPDGVGTTEESDKMVAHAAIPTGVGEGIKLCPEVERLLDKSMKELGGVIAPRQCTSLYEARNILASLCLKVQTETVRHYAPDQLPDWAKEKGDDAVQG